MKRAAAVFLLVLFAATCAPEAPKPLSEPGERLYVVHGVIVNRNRADDSLKIQHQRIEGFMEAMTMDFPVRGQRLDDLPKNGSTIEAKLHVTRKAFWITDVRAVAPN